MNEAVLEARDAQQLRELGRGLGGLLLAGDLVVLSGALGAGKTTLVQGIAAGLGVRGPVTSPTFVIARVHPSLGEGPDLIHVDAYRLTSIEEVEELDLESSMASSVTVVEWGEDSATVLHDSPIWVTIERDVEPREVRLRFPDDRRLQRTP